MLKSVICIPPPPSKTPSQCWYILLVFFFISVCVCVCVCVCWEGAEKWQRDHISSVLFQQTVYALKNIFPCHYIVLKNISVFLCYIIICIDLHFPYLSYLHIFATINNHSEESNDPKTGFIKVPK